MAVDDVYEIRLVGRIDDQNTVNVIHCRVATETGGGAGVNAIGAAVNTRFAAPMAAVCSDQWFYRGCIVRKVKPTPTALVPVPQTPQLAGGSPGAVMPYQICALLSLRSSFAPPKTRGRFYVPPTAAANMQPGNTWAPAYVTQLTALANLLGPANWTVTDAGATTEMDPCIYSQRTFIAPSTTTTIVRTYPATQRRRSRISGGDAPLL